MRNRGVLSYGLALTGLVGMGLFAWTQATPAIAQEDAPKPAPQFAGEKASGLAASGDFIYVLRGNTVYQMKSSDLSLVTQKELPDKPGGN